MADEYVYDDNRQFVIDIFQRWTMTEMYYTHMWKDFVKELKNTPVSFFLTLASESTLMEGAYPDSYQNDVFETMYYLALAEGEFYAVENTDQVKWAQEYKKKFDPVGSLYSAVAIDMLYNDKYGRKNHPKNTYRPKYIERHLAGEIHKYVKSEDIKLIPTPENIYELEEKEKFPSDLFEFARLIAFGKLYPPEAISKLITTVPEMGMIFVERYENAKKLGLYISETIRKIEESLVYDEMSTDMGMRKKRSRRRRKSGRRKSGRRKSRRKSSSRARTRKSR